MTQTATDYLEAIGHLPVGGKLYLEDVSWDEYEELLEEHEGKRHVRISYDNGRMEIITLSPEHEMPASLFGYLIPASSPPKAPDPTTCHDADKYAYEPGKTVEVKKGSEQ